MAKPLNGIALLAYFRRLGFSQETQELLIHIRSSPPSRTPGARRGNMPVWGPPPHPRATMLGNSCGHEVGNSYTFSLSEAASGSDAASLQCRAERRDNYYVLNGTKMWVTNGGVADIYLLMARTGGGKGSAGITCFVVEKGTMGFSFGKTERKMGLHSSPTRELIFSDCKVPVANRLGEEGQGFKIALSSLDGGRINIGAIAVGVAQAAFEIARNYAR